jgi:hypothetical protein
VLNGRAIDRVSFRFVRHNEANESVLRAPAEEAAALAEITERSARLGTRIAVDGDEALCSA